jgi:hypothetical protein
VLDVSTSLSAAAAAVVAPLLVLHLHLSAAHLTLYHQHPCLPLPVSLLLTALPQVQIFTIVFFSTSLLSSSLQAAATDPMLILLFSSSDSSQVSQHLRPPAISSPSQSTKELGTNTSKVENLVGNSSNRSRKRSTSQSRNAISRLQTIIKCTTTEEKKHLPTNRKTIELKTKSLIFLSLSLGQQNTVGKKAPTTTPPPSTLL